MFLVRVFLNGLIMAAELAAVAAVAMFGFYHPFLFAGVTAILSFLVGMRLEHARLLNEYPFYFEEGRGPRFWFVRFVGFSESAVKGLLAGLAAVFTFAGTDHERLFWVAIVFAVSIYLGSLLLRSLSLNLGGRPARWGYFRLAAPLGIVFSAGLTLLALLEVIPMPSISQIGLGMLWDMPARPSVEQVSELVFQLKQAFDDFVVRALSVFMHIELARALGILLSVNMLTGFVSALYAALIAQGVRKAEDTVL